MYITGYNSLTHIRFKDYFELLKPRVMVLVLFTGMVGMSLAPEHLPPLTAITAIFCMALGGGAAGAINMWVERESDALMERTKNRPIPSGRISPDAALIFALSTATLCVVIMALGVNYISALLLLATILFYVFIYTIWLKPRTPLNIVIGGAAGALPPVIGWAAVTGTITLEPVILFLIIFLWTPPHFWALALAKSEDYQRACIPMLPVTAGHDATMCQMLVYIVVLVPVSLLPYLLGMSGIVYAIGATALGCGFMFYCLRLWQTKNLHYAMPMFTYSLLYLTGIFLLLFLDRIY